jgi:hypothetical protein
MNVPTTERTISLKSIASGVLATGALGLGLLGLAAPAASAGSPESIHTDGGYVSFYDIDEELTASDSRGEGWGVRAKLKWGEKGYETVTDDQGAGGRPVDEDLTIREGTTVYLKMCYTNNGKDVKCSNGWQEGTA